MDSIKGIRVLSLPFLLSNIVMSSRRPPVAETDHVAQLRSEIQDLKNNVSSPYNGESPSSPSLSFDMLNDTEKACASLGVGPEQFRPLGWLNAAHFDSLLKSNQMDDTLVRRLEAYKVVAARDA